MTTTITYKTCSQCAETKISTEFYSGRGNCKVCKRAATAKYYADHAKPRSPHSYGGYLKTGIRICSKCHQEKPLDMFYPLGPRTLTNGHIVVYRQPMCKICYGIEHKVKWLSLSPEEKLRRSRRYNKDKKAAYGKLYRHRNRKKINAWFVQHYRYKRANDVEFKIKSNLRRRFHEALHGKRKVQPTLNLIGCTPASLMEHLESLWKPGMTWSNYGHKGWHIDHIRPCASFDLTDPEQQKQCFHWTNLQPLWAEENYRKGSRQT